LQLLQPLRNPKPDAANGCLPFPCEVEGTMPCNRIPVTEKVIMIVKKRHDESVVVELQLRR